MIAQALGSPPALLQWTLSAFILAFGAESAHPRDRSPTAIGRRPVLLWGLGLYALAGIGCTLVADAARLLVAFASSCKAWVRAPVPCARAIAQDLSTDRAGATFPASDPHLGEQFRPGDRAAARRRDSKTLRSGGVRSTASCAVIGVAARGRARGRPACCPKRRHGESRIRCGQRTAACAAVAARTLGLMLLVGGSFFGFFSLISAGSPFALIAQLHLTRHAIRDRVRDQLSSRSSVAAVLSGAARTTCWIPRSCSEAASRSSSSRRSSPLSSTPTIRRSSASSRRGRSTRSASRSPRPSAFGALLSTARSGAGLAAGLIGGDEHAGRRARQAARRRATGLPTTTLGLFRIDRRHHRNRRIRSLEAGVAVISRQQGRRPAPTMALTRGAAANSRAPSRRRCGSRS